ncbi:MAG: inositol monophosphatase, partial [Alphaproteobacteria bacterium]|nr:inositol monophosphatase [Alphaproteobacteria bacterium]
MFDEKRVGAIARAALENILLPSRKNLAVLESHEKMPGELVTSADVESQRFIHSELEALCPGAQFLGEELQDGRSPDLNALAGYEGLWIVDPLDGTSVYASG